MLPAKFKARFDGQAYTWISGSIDGEQLRQKLKHAEGNPVYINGCEVFELIFTNGQRWNVQKGWDA